MNLIKVLCEINISANVSSCNYHFTTYFEEDTWIRVDGNFFFKVRSVRACLCECVCLCVCMPVYVSGGMWVCARTCSLRCSSDLGTEAAAFFIT